MLNAKFYNGCYKGHITSPQPWPLREGRSSAPLCRLVISRTIGGQPAHARIALCFVSWRNLS